MAHPPTVLALARYVNGFYFGELIEGLIRRVRAAGGRVLVVQTAVPGDTSEEMNAQSFGLPVGWEQVDGVVAFTASVDVEHLRALRAAGLPVVLAGAEVPGFDAPAAMPDNVSGVRAAVDHLVAHGHARIAFVGATSQQDYRERRTAYDDGMARHGLPTDGLFFPAEGHSRSAGAAVAADVLGAEPRPTAAVTASDSTALGLVPALVEAGVRVPEDLAVIGFDDESAAASTTPSVSSVHQRFDAVGATAGDLVLAMVAGEEVPPGRVVARGSALVPRASCGCRSAAQATTGLRGVPARAADLDALMHTLFDDRGLTHAEVSTICQAFSATLEDGDGARVHAFVATLRRLAGAVAPEVARVLTEFLDRIMDSDAAEDVDARSPALSRMATALWRLQSHALIEQSDRREASIIEHSDVSVDLLGASTDFVRSLEWMRKTHVRAGVLGLWDGPPGGRLTVAGTFDRHGDALVGCEQGASYDVQAFPPPALVSGARDGEVCLVVPVRDSDRDWGLLVVLGAITTTWNREAYHHWATVISMALAAGLLQDAVRRSEERYAWAARAANDGLWELDVTTGALFLSERCGDILGIDVADATVADLRATAHPDDLPGLVEAIAAATEHAGVPVETEYRVRRGGDERWVLCRGLGIAGNGEVTRVVGSLSDIDPRKELESRLRHAALFDPVTDLPNRRLFLERLAMAMAEVGRRPGARYAVIFLDLDGFKLINDSLGHLAGDELLRVVGRRLRADLRAVDTAARFGGDEFAVLLADPVPEEVLVIAARIQERIADPVMLGEDEVAVTASVGIATSESGYTSPEDVLRDADTAMYQAKEARGSATVFDPAMHQRATQRLRSRGELRTAIAERQFVVHYQPIVHLAGSPVSRFEALVRWQHPEKGLLLPGQFLPAMTDNATIIALGHLVLDDVCARIAAWRQAGTPEVSVAVNLSHPEFWDERLVAVVTETLERHGVPGTCLVLEITESVVMVDPAAARTVMEKLRAQGVRLHVDDFGTGQSSLNALRTLPVDALKIDGSFVRDMALTERSAALVQAVVAMGDALGLEVIAECVETNEQAERLRAMGCTQAQGWLYARAVPADRATALLGHPLDGAVPPEDGERSGDDAGPGQRTERGEGAAP